MPGPRPPGPKPCLHKPTTGPRRAIRPSSPQAADCSALRHLRPNRLGDPDGSAGRLPLEMASGWGGEPNCSSWAAPQLRSSGCSGDPWVCQEQLRLLPFLCPQFPCSIPTPANDATARVGESNAVRSPGLPSGLAGELGAGEFRPFRIGQRGLQGGIKCSTLKTAADGVASEPNGDLARPPTR